MTSVWTEARTSKSRQQHKPYPNSILFPHDSSQASNSAQTDLHRPLLLRRNQVRDRPILTRRSPHMTLPLQDCKVSLLPYPHNTLSTILPCQSSNLPKHERATGEKLTGAPARSTSPALLRHRIGLTAKIPVQSFKITAGTPKEHISDHGSTRLSTGNSAPRAGPASWNMAYVASHVNSTIDPILWLSPWKGK